MPSADQRLISETPDAPLEGYGSWPAIPPPRGLLSLKDVGQALGVSERYVKSLIYSGVLPSVTIGRLRRVYIGDLHAYIDERRHAARQLSSP